MAKATVVPFRKAHPELRAGFIHIHAHILVVIPDELDHPELTPKWFNRFKRCKHGISVKFREETKETIYVSYRR